MNNLIFIRPSCSDKTTSVRTYAITTQNYDFMDHDKLMGFLRQFANLFLEQDNKLRKDIIKDGASFPSCI